MTRIETLIEAGIVSDNNLPSDVFEAISAAREEDIAALIQLRESKHSNPQPNIF